MQKAINKFLITFSLLFLCSLAFSYAQLLDYGVEKEHGKIQWMSFTDAVTKNDQQPKKILIDVYTKWCGWCKRMDATTYEDTTVIDYISKNFYAVKFDAETHDTIRFHDKIFVFRPDYKANELALSLLNGQMGYPTTVFLDESYNMLSPVSGFQTTEQLLPQLKFFAEGIYKTKKFEDYRNEINKQ